MEHWRERLREAVERTGEKRAAIAFGAGITPETLSRILNAANQRPSLATVAKIAHAVGVSVGWLLGEEDYALTADERARLRHVARLILDTLGTGG